MSLVTFEAVDGVGTITLNRPEASNAFDMPTTEALRAAITAAESDDVRVVLLQGAGPRFCAGGDVASFHASADPSTYLHELATALEVELTRLADLPKPVIAGVQGAVAGAGLAAMLNADVIVAGRGTKFVAAYSGIGLTPDCGVSRLLPQAVGMQRALAFTMTGRVLKADEALTWGLVTEVVDDDAVGTRAAEIAAGITAGPAWALGQTKRLVRGSALMSRADHAADEAATIASAVTTPDGQRLISAFVNR